MAKDSCKTVLLYFKNGLSYPTVRFGVLIKLANYFLSTFKSLKHPILVNLEKKMNLTKTREMFAMLKREKKCTAWSMNMRDARNAEKADSLVFFKYLVGKILCYISLVISLIRFTDKPEVKFQN